MNNLKDLYKETIGPNLMKEFNYSSIMEVPKLDKIVINMGVGEGAHDSKFIEAACKDLETITGQNRLLLKLVNQLLDSKLEKDIPLG